MTAIVAYRHDRGVTVGGDSAGVGYYSLQLRADPKVFRVGKLLIGYTTSFRMAQLIRYGLHDALKVADLNPPNDEVDGFEFMVTDFVPRVRYLFNHGGFMSVESNREIGGTFIVAWGRSLFQVQDNLQVAQPIDDFMACGCGEDLALGAMFAMEGSELSPRAKVTRALQAAERFSAGVRGPFVIQSTVDLR